MHLLFAAYPRRWFLFLCKASNGTFKGGDMAAFCSNQFFLLHSELVCISIILIDHQIINLCGDLTAAPFAAPVIIARLPGGHWACRCTTTAFFASGFYVCVKRCSRKRIHVSLDDAAHVIGLAKSQWRSSRHPSYS